MVATAVRNFLVPLQLNQLPLKQVAIESFINSSAVLGTPIAGQMYYDNTANAMFIYNGTQWVTTDWSSVTNTIAGNLNQCTVERSEPRHRRRIDDHHELYRG